MSFFVIVTMLVVGLNAGSTCPLIVRVASDFAVEAGHDVMECFPIEY